MSKYSDNLLGNVINHSNSKNWADAVLEWEVFDCVEDYELSSTCVCGKEHLRYVFTIRNILNNNFLSPIGSVCIKKFGRSDLSEFVDIREAMFKLLHAVETKEYIELDAEYFSRKLLTYFYNIGVFKDNNYNNFNAYNDYDFMLKMFNKKNKNDVTFRQRSKIKGIIISEIIPFLEKELSHKIIRYP